MNQKQRLALFLEPLEERWVPATVRLVGSAVLINPSGGQALGLTVTQQTTPNTFSISDHGMTLKTGIVSNIRIMGGNGADSITVDLAGKAYTGNLFASTGNGNDTVSILSGGGAGALLGNTNILGGLGNDTVALNSAGTTALTFGGSVQVMGTTGNASVSFGNATTSSTIGGDLSLVGTSSVLLGNNSLPHQAYTIGGNLSVQDSTLSQPVSFFATDAGTVGKNMSLNLGSGADTVQFGQFTVNGNSQINLGAGSDSVVVRGATFNGDLTVNGSGSASVELSSNLTSVGGALRLNLGDGNNQLDLTPSGSLAVAGDFSLTEGNGNDSVALINTSVNGNFNGRFGNGTDGALLDFAPGGTLNWNSGNGSDTVVMGVPAGTPGTPVLNVHMQFGNGDDSVALLGSTALTLPVFGPVNGTPGILTGSIDGGGRLTANTFFQNDWTVGSPFQLSNFP